MPDDRTILARTSAAIEAAFADAPRPSNDALLHEQCKDDNDIANLYAVEHWREIPDELVDSEYAALSFLSPEGFRHFIPAYMGFTLRNLDSGAAAVDSTIWSLAPVFYDDAGVRSFVVSKLELLTDSQRAAVVAFLDAVRELGDDYRGEQAELALGYWRPGIADPLPEALAGLVSELTRAGYSVTGDESSGEAFREVTLQSEDRSFGSVVRITKERGLWGVELSVEGDDFQSPDAVLCAVEGRALASRAMGYDEMRAATLEALARMPSSESEREAVRARLRAFDEDYTRGMSGRDRELADARGFFEAGDFRAAIDAYERLRDDELARADRVRLRIARRRTEGS